MARTVAGLVIWIFGSFLIVFYPSWLMVKPFEGSVYFSAEWCPSIDSLPDCRGLPSLVEEVLKVSAIVQLPDGTDWVLGRSRSGKDHWAPLTIVGFQRINYELQIIDLVTESTDFVAPELYKNGGIYDVLIELLVGGY